MKGSNKLKKIVLFLTIMMVALFACSSTESEVVVEDGVEVVKSTVNVTMAEWDVNVDPNYKMGKHISPGALTLNLTNEGMLEHNLVLLNNNKLITLPESIHYMPALRDLDLRNNQYM